jgi:hypothetical protein
MKPFLLALALPGLLLANPAQAASSCPPGFAMLQASDTCVRISGRVRSDTLARSPGLRSSDRFETRASGRIQLDVRKQTDYGPLRAVVRIDTHGR